MGLLHVTATSAGSAGQRQWVDDHTAADLDDDTCFVERSTYDAPAHIAFGRRAREEGTTQNGPTDGKHVDTRQFPTANCTTSKDSVGQPGESAKMGTPWLKRAPRRPRIAANNGTQSRPPRSAVSLFSLITKPVIDR